MPLAPSFVGRSYGWDEVFEVRREHIGAFADAIGDPNPAYRDPEAARALGYPDVIAPPTFPMVISFQATRPIVDDPELGLDYSRVVHGEQRFVHSRPIRAGDRLRAVSHIESIRSTAGNDLLKFRTEITGDDGEHLVTAYCTLVARGTVQGEGA